MSQAQSFSDARYQPLARKPVATQAVHELTDARSTSQQDTNWSTADRLPTAKPERARAPRVEQSLFIVWWLEILCCFVTAAMLLAIVLILLPYHGQTPLKKLPYRLSLNTVLAILTTILKTCSLVAVAEGLSQLKWEHFKLPTSLQYLVRYDAANRGPWGCIALISTLGPRHFLAITGAILSILFIAVESFTQQLVEYAFCTIDATNGSIAYMPRTSLYWDSLDAYATDSQALRLNQRNAILTGLFNPAEVKVPAQCITGNCTFDTSYATVAFCTSCDDVTNELTHSYFNTTVEGQPVDMYNTSLPSGLSAAVAFAGQNTDLFSMAVVGGALSPNETVAEIVFEMILGSSDPAQSLPPDYWAVAWGENSNGDACAYAWQNETWGCRGQGAARCTVKPCVQVLQGSVKSAMTNEDIVDVYSDWFHGTGSGNRTSYDQLVMADLSCVDKATKIKLQDLGYNVSASRFIPYDVAIWTDGSLMQLTTQLDMSDTNETGLPILSDDQISLVPKECIYQVSGNTISAIHNFYATTFSQQIGATDGFAQLTGEVQALRILNNSYVSAESIETLFDGMAKSMSVLARQTVFMGQPIYNTPAEGVVKVGATCVIVRWPWLIYPACLAALTVWFLIGVILRTEMFGHDNLARGWKSSLLPLIYHGIDGGDAYGATREGQLSDIDLMKKAAHKDAGSITSTTGYAETVTF